MQQARGARSLKQFVLLASFLGQPADVAFDLKLQADVRRWILRVDDQRIFGPIEQQLQCGQCLSVLAFVGEFHGLSKHAIQLRIDERHRRLADTLWRTTRKEHLPRQLSGKQKHGGADRKRAARECPLHGYRFRFFRALNCQRFAMVQCIPRELTATD